jgi:taurine dioxygenase
MDQPIKQFDGMTVSPLGAAPFGKEISGLKPRVMTEAQRAAILEAYRDGHGLLCFQFEAMLEEDELHAMTSVFGENEFAPGLINGIGKKALPGEEHLTVEDQVAAHQANGRDPYLAYIGNVDPKSLAVEKTPDKFFGEWEWHTDMSYIPTPPTFSLLHARIIPEEGGDTGFCSQVMAAQALPADLRRKILPLQIKHDSTYASNGLLRPGMSVPDSPIEAIGHPHPIIRKVPSTGDEALFLGRRTNAYVVGLPLDESEALLDELWAHATKPEFQYHHNWTVGQVVAWDNRMMLHMRSPVDTSKARFMWRTQTKGEGVVSAA